MSGAELTMLERIQPGGGGANYPPPVNQQASMPLQSQLCNVLNTMTGADKKQIAAMAGDLASLTGMMNPMDPKGQALLA